MPNTSNTPRFTIITPSYNQGAYLEETIHSVLNQDYKNIEYFVIDGGSKDNTLEVIRKYESRLTYWISEKDSGQSEAINKGLKIASGEFVGWINSDDILMPGTLSNVVSYFTRNPQIDFVNGYTLRIDKNSRILYNHFIPKQKKWYARKGVYYVAQPSMFWRKKINDEIGLLREDFHAQMDKEFLIRIFSNDFKIGYIKRILAAVRIHELTKTSMNGTIWSDDSKKIMELYGSEYGGEPKSYGKIVYGLEKLLKGLYIKQWYFGRKWKNHVVKELNQENCIYLNKI
jgi:glycosyltransferase involved in cell wall biosynthesis